MSAPAKSQDTHFSDYIKLLVQLADLMRRGFGDDDEAELVRDRMEVHWYELDPATLKIVRGLSADLYSIGVERPQQGTIESNVAEQLHAMIDAANWSAALDMVREHAAALPPDEVAGLRGICWQGLGQNEAASVFFKEAMRINPRAAKFEIPRLWMLVRSGQIEAAVAVAQALPSDAWSKFIFMQHNP